MDTRANFHKSEELKQQNSFSFHVLEARSLNSVSLGNGAHSPPSLCLPASVSPWGLITESSAPTLHCLFLFSLCQLSHCLSLLWTLVNGFRAHLHNPGESPHIQILNLIASAKIPFFGEDNIYRFRGKGPKDIGWLLTT